MIPLGTQCSNMNMHRPVLLVGLTTLVLLLLAAVYAYIFMGITPLMIGAYSMALQDAHGSVPYARKFLYLYPDCESYFSYFTGTAGQPTLNMEVGLYGRYTLSMYVPVEFNWSRRRIISYGEPRFKLIEVDRISDLGDGRVEITYGDLQVRFGPHEWEKIVNEGGKLTVLGVNLVRDQPVSGFEKCWRQR